MAFYGIIVSIKFKEFFEDERKEKTITCFRYPIYRPWFAISNRRSRFGIIGLVLANSHQKESELDYKTERILNIVGIVISVVNWIAGVVLMMH